MKSKNLIVEDDTVLTLTDIRKPHERFVLLGHWKVAGTNDPQIMFLVLRDDCLPRITGVNEIDLPTFLVSLGIDSVVDLPGITQMIRDRAGAPRLVGGKS